MNVNEILEQIQDFDLNSVLSELGKSSHVLTQAEIIVLAAAAVVGIMIGMFGLRIVRFWACWGSSQDLREELMRRLWRDLILSTPGYQGWCLESCWQCLEQNCTGSVCL